MKLISSLDYVTRSDDIRNKRLWTVDPITKKIYNLYVIQAYPLDKVADELGLNVHLVTVIIDGVRMNYKVNLKEFVKTIFDFKIIMPLKTRKLQRSGTLKF